MKTDNRSFNCWEQPINLNEMKLFPYNRGSRFASFVPRERHLCNSISLTTSLWSESSHPPVLREICRELRSIFRAIWIAKFFFSKLSNFYDFLIFFSSLFSDCSFCCSSHTMLRNVLLRNLFSFQLLCSTFFFYEKMISINLHNYFIGLYQDEERDDKFASRQQQLLPPTGLIKWAHN